MYFYERSLYATGLILCATLYALAYKIIPNNFIALLVIILISFALLLWANEIGRRRVTKSYSAIENLMTEIMPLLIFFVSFVAMPIEMATVFGVVSFISMLLLTNTYVKAPQDDKNFLKNDAYKPQDLWTIAWPTLLINIIIMLVAFIYWGVNP